MEKAQEFVTKKFKELTGYNLNNIHGFEWEHALYEMDDDSFCFSYVFAISQFYLHRSTLKSMFKKHFAKVTIEKRWDEYEGETNVEITHIVFYFTPQTILVHERKAKIENLLNEL